VSLSLDLRLDDRKPDRVLVSVRLSPEGEVHPVDGVALQLCSEDGECLGPRLLLPIHGSLAGPVVTRAELRSADPIPRNGRVVAVAWWGREQVEVTCPSDRGTSLEVHMRGQSQVALPARVTLRLLDEAERAALVRRLPWIDEPLAKAHPRIEPVDPEPDADELCAEIGLDGEDAAWLKDLLESDDDL